MIILGFVGFATSECTIGWHFLSYPLNNVSCICPLTHTQTLLLKHNWHPLGHVFHPHIFITSFGFLDWPAPITCNSVLFWIRIGIKAKEGVWVPHSITSIKHYRFWGIGITFSIVCAFPFWIGFLFSFLKNEMI